MDVGWKENVKTRKLFWTILTQLSSVQPSTNSFDKLFHSIWYKFIHNTEDVEEPIQNKVNSIEFGVSFEFKNRLFGVSIIL